MSRLVEITSPNAGKFYLFAKLLLKQLPYEPVTLPREIMDMVDMEKFRVQEEQNGSIILATEDAASRKALSVACSVGKSVKFRIRASLPSSSPFLHEIEIFGG